MSAENSDASGDPQITNKPILVSSISNIDPKILEAFGKCTSDEQRFRIAYKWYRACDDGSQPEVVHRKKNITEAETSVKSGLKLAAVGKYTKALEAMSRAVVAAPWKTPNTTEAYDPYCVVDVLLKRAELLIQMGRHLESVADFQQALTLGSGERVKELLTRKAQQLLAANRPSEAIIALEAEAESLRLGEIDEKRKKRLEGEKAEAEDLLARKETPKEEKTRLRELLQKNEKEAARMEEEEKKFVALLARAKKEEKRLGRRKHGAEPSTPLWRTSKEAYEEVENLKLKKGPHRAFPSASAVCKLKETDIRERHFVAREGLQVGDVVLIEKAFVSCVMAKGPYTHCYACHQFTDVPQPCETCTTVVFCSLECTKTPRAELHAGECTFWQTFACYPAFSDSKSMLATVSSFGMVMAARILLMKTAAQWEEFFESIRGYDEGEADKAPPFKKVYLSDDYWNVFWLKKRVTVFSQNDLCAAAILAAGCINMLEIVHFKGENELSEPLKIKVGSLIIRHMLNFSINFHAITEASVGRSQTLRVGTMVLPTCHLFSFSCSPNLIVVPYGDVVVVRANRTIQKGEPLTLFPVGANYIDSFEDRQKALLEKFGWKCPCLACIEKWPGVEVLRDRFVSRNFQVRCVRCRFVVDASGVICPGCGVEILLSMRAIDDAHRTLLAFEKKWCTLGKPPGDIAAASPFIDTISMLSRDPFYPKILVQSVVSKWAKLYGNKCP